MVMDFTLKNVEACIREIEKQTDDKQTHLIAQTKHWNWTLVNVKF